MLANRPQPVVRYYSSSNNPRKSVANNNLQRYSNNHSPNQTRDNLEALLVSNSNLKPPNNNHSNNPRPSPSWTRRQRLRLLTVQTL